MPSDAEAVSSTVVLFLYLKRKGIDAGPKSTYEDHSTHKQILWQTYSFVNQTTADLFCDCLVQHLISYSRLSPVQLLSGIVTWGC